MKKIEIFLEERKNQSQFMAMMIPRWLENTNRFVGKKSHTLQGAENFKKDA